jgi:quinol monooxygenase YgiN
MVRGIDYRISPVVRIQTEPFWQSTYGVPHRSGCRFACEAGREKALQELLVQMLEPTRDEPGCLTYDLHQSVVDPELFFVYAVWQDETCVEKHSRMKHAQAFKNVAPDLLEGPVLLK